MKRVTLAKARPQARLASGTQRGRRSGQKRGRKTRTDDRRCALVKPVGTLIREIKFSNETQPDPLPLSPAAVRFRFSSRKGDTMNSQNDPSSGSKTTTVTTIMSKKSIIVSRFPAAILSADNTHPRYFARGKKIYISYLSWLENCSCRRDTLR